MTEPLVTDQELIQSVLDGRQDDYAPLIRRHLDRVLSVCRAYLQDDTTCEDAAQEIFLKAYKNLSQFSGKSAFGTWLYRLAINHCLDIKRSLKRKPTESLDDLLSKGFDPTSTPPSNNKELAEALLNRLEPQERAILTLRETTGLSYAEIAEALNLSEDAVKSRLKRARQALIEAARHFFTSSNV